MQKRLHISGTLIRLSPRIYALSFQFCAYRFLHQWVLKDELIKIHKNLYVHSFPIKAIRA